MNYLRTLVHTNSEHLMLIHWKQVVSCCVDGVLLTRVFTFTRTIRPISFILGASETIPTVRRQATIYHVCYTASMKVLSKTIKKVVFNNFMETDTMSSIMKMELHTKSTCSLLPQFQNWINIFLIQKYDREGNVFAHGHRLTDWTRTDQKQTCFSDYI